MNPFYFGRSERPLFGLFTRGQSTASAGAASGRAVLLCHPIGSEYMRAHRAFRQLTTLLNRAGLDVLRFDYSGTGDSAGDGDEATFDDWLDDVDWAIDELMDTAGVDTLDVVGLRWGATLAALAARSRDEIRHLVLWDPVVSGASYLEEVLPHPCPQGTVGIEGYPFSASLRAGLEGIDLRQSLREGTSPSRTSVVVSRDHPEFQALTDPLTARGDTLALDIVPAPGSWSDVDPFGDALIPQDIIRSIVDRLREGA